MPFFSDAAPGGFEPKRKHRWTVSFKNLGNDITFMAKQAAKPSFTTTPTKHQFMNHEFKYPGIVSWQDVEVTLVDSFEPNIGSVFWNVLLNSGYDLPTNFTDSLLGLTKVSSVATIGDVVIRQVDGGNRAGTGGMTAILDPGEIVGPAVGPFIREEWTLKNAFVKDVSWSNGAMTYSSDAGLVEVKVGLTYDFATYLTSPSAAGIGEYT